MTFMGKTDTSMFTLNKAFENYETGETTFPGASAIGLALYQGKSENLDN